MNAKLKTSLHDEIFLLLPWYVNETLGPDELTEVESHVDDCAICRDEINLLMQVQHAANTRRDVHTIAQNGFASVMQRVEATESAPAAKPGFLMRVKERFFDSSFIGIGGRGWATALPAMVVVLVAGAWLHMPNYGTVDDGVDEEALRFRVTFMQGTSDATARELVGGMHDEVTYTDLGSGRYVLEVPPDTEPAAALALLKRLQSDPAVAAAELVR